MSDGTGAAATPGTVARPLRPSPSDPSSRSTSTPRSIRSPREPPPSRDCGGVGFLLGVAGFAGFGAAYWQNATNFWLGGTLGDRHARASATGFVAWGKYLMPRGPFSEDRHLLAPTAEERQAFVEDFAARGKVAVERRTFLVKTLGLAAGGLRHRRALPAHTLTRAAAEERASTRRRGGRARTSRRQTVAGSRSTTSRSAAFITVFPPDDIGGALSQTMLIHVTSLRAATSPPQPRPRDAGAPQGYVAFSKVCTHAGCPVGPLRGADRAAALSVPPVAVRRDRRARRRSSARHRARCRSCRCTSTRRATSGPRTGYDEPIGPGFWERGGTT